MYTVNAEIYNYHIQPRDSCMSISILVVQGVDETV